MGHTTPDRPNNKNNQMTFSTVTGTSLSQAIPPPVPSQTGLIFALATHFTGLKCKIQKWEIT